MTKVKPIKWPKGGKAARDASLIEATCAQRELLSILTDDLDRREEYRRIGRAIGSINRVIRELQSVEPEREATT